MAGEDDDEGSKAASYLLHGDDSVLSAEGQELQRGLDDMMVTDQDVNDNENNGVPSVPPPAVPPAVPQAVPPAMPVQAIPDNPPPLVEHNPAPHANHNPRIDNSNAMDVENNDGQASVNSQELKASYAAAKSFITLKNKKLIRKGSYAWDYFQLAEVKPNKMSDLRDQDPAAHQYFIDSEKEERDVCSCRLCYDNEELSLVASFKKTDQKGRGPGNLTSHLKTVHGIYPPSSNVKPSPRVSSTLTTPAAKRRKGTGSNNSIGSSIHYRFLGF